MAFRGRGRGRGRGGGGGGFGFSFAKQEPFILFPGDVELPSIPTVSENERNLIKQKALLERYWKLSPYYLQLESTDTSSQVSEVERYSDKKKPEVQVKRESLSCYLKLTSSYFPVELIQGAKRAKQKEKLRWDPRSEQKALDLFEKLEEKTQGQDEKDTAKKKGEGEDEDDEEQQEEEEEDDEDNDYYENIYFDDDEDDLNLDEGDADDEPCFD